MTHHRILFGVAAAAAVTLALAGCSAAGGSSSRGAEKLGLVTGGELTICANLETPPNIYATADGTPVGVEVDIAKAMAKQMKLKVNFKEYNFSGLVTALQAHQCDTIISSLYIKPEREKIASFVPYLNSGSGVAVAKVNPKHVTGYDDSLCGLKVVGITGATGATLLSDRSKKCVAAGKPAIQITLTDKSANALQGVIAGQYDAFMDTAELVNFYDRKSKGQFVPVGDTVGKIQIGAASLKGNKPLHAALQKAFDTVQKDGAYEKILKKWSFESLDLSK
jgi:polar amino acid transport system substrate-binding protein